MSLCVSKWYISCCLKTQIRFQTSVHLSIHVWLYFLNYSEFINLITILFFLLAFLIFCYLLIAGKTMDVMLCASLQMLVKYVINCSKYNLLACLLSTYCLLMFFYILALCCKVLALAYNKWFILYDVLSSLYVWI